MPTVIYKVEQSQINAILWELRAYPDQFKTAARDALNRTFDHGKSVAADDLSKALTAGRNSVLKRIGVSKATKSKLNATLYIRGGRGISLYGFRARQTKSGVTATVAGESKQVPHAFIARGLSGNKIVALRDTSQAKRAPLKGRYGGHIISRGPRKGQPLLRQPIEAQYGPSAAEVFETKPNIAIHTNKEIELGLPKNLASQAERFLK